MDASFNTRVVNAAVTTTGSTSSSGGAAFRQAVAQVRRIDAPLSAALNTPSESGALQSLMANQQNGRRRLDRLMAETQRSGLGGRTTDLMLEAINVSVVNDLTAKCVGKAFDGINRTTTLA